VEAPLYQVVLIYSSTLQLIAILLVT